MWDSRQILKDLADAERRARILGAFWRYAEAGTRTLAVAQLARAMRFREESFRKLPVEKKAEYLGARAHSPEFAEHVDLALMQYHTHEQNEMMAAFLDHWKVPHVNGEIEADEYTVPTREQVEEAAGALQDRFDVRDMAVYLATAGLLMGDQWREATWPVVDGMSAKLGNPPAV